MSTTLSISIHELHALLDALVDQGYQPIGPRIERGAIVYDTITFADDLPVGYQDEQAGGHYRLVQADPASPESKTLFRYVVGPHSWKRFLFPPRQQLWQAHRTEAGFTLEPEVQDPARYAFFGVRACELAAIAIQDRVFVRGDFADSGYRSRREQALVVAVNCTRPAGNCFCASMQTGPRVQAGFDLCLTELLDDDGHRFLVEVGSERGRTLMGPVSRTPATPQELEHGREALEEAACNMGRQMPPDAAGILRRNQEHPRWLEVADRCLSCANCTMVCPTCFCSTVEDFTTLDGSEAGRRRQWDSCFTLDFSYVYGGPVRRATAARYRQWISHKLAHWHDQFGASGCTGCGRCITWCPVGIDITEEVAAIRYSEGAAWVGGGA